MSQSEPQTILVVDDERSHRLLIRKHLSESGMRILEASDGAEALRVILTEMPSILVTDWAMPGMDGPTLCRAIRENEAVGFLYIIVATAHDEDARVGEVFAAGADDYLPKPFSRRQLLTRLRAAQRIIELQCDLERRNREIHRSNAELLMVTDELAKVNRKLNLLATTDELTGALNRREAMNRLNVLWQTGNRNGELLSCIMLDVDHFKKFNDTWGHAAGDQVLREVAATLKRTARISDLVCRVGGEEFLIICPNTQAQAGALLGERVRKRVEERGITYGEQTLKVTISVGVADRAKDMNAADELVRVADEALYAAKRSGRNRVCVGPSAAFVDTDRSPRRRTPPVFDNLELPGERKPHVLVVDNDVAARECLRTILIEGGFEVNEACDGFAALKLVESEPPDLVLMDVVMPGMDGVECTRSIKSNPVTRDIPIICISGFNDRDQTVATLEAGAEEFLPKPIDGELLLLCARALTRMYLSHRQLQRVSELRAEQTLALTLLLNYSRDLAATESLEGILETTAAACAEVMCSRRVVILLPDDEGRHLIPVKSVGGTEGEPPSLPARGRGLIGGVWKSRERVVLSEASEAQGMWSGREARLFGRLPAIFAPLKQSDQMVGVLCVSDPIDGKPFSEAELEYVDLISNMAAWAIHDVQGRQAQEGARDSIVIALAKLAEHRDNDTGRHLERVTQFCVLLADAMRSNERYGSTITDDFLRDLERAVPLHDIGKVAIPDHILLKPGVLTTEEMAIMQSHARIGAETIQMVRQRAAGVSFLAMAEDIAHAHHERVDGKGYPRALSGEDIPLSARIASVADVYDALTTKRVYKPAIPHEIAVEIIKEGAGTQFDRDVVDAFLSLAERFSRLAKELADEGRTAQERVISEHARPAAVPALV